MSLILCKKKLKIRPKMKCIYNLLTNALNRFNVAKIKNVTNITFSWSIFKF